MTKLINTAATSADNVAVDRAATGYVDIINVPNGTTVSASPAAAAPNTNAATATPSVPTPDPRYTSVDALSPAPAVTAPKTRAQYVDSFRHSLRATNLSTIEMCRIVYEAKQSLSVCDFADFCSEIGYKDDGPTIRKFIVIGKLAPRLSQYVELLPDSWTSIYAITQIPASVFDHMVNNGISFRTIKGSDLKQLLKDTKPKYEVSHYLPIDTDTNNYIFGKLMFTRKPDVIDWRAMRKALAEVEARLPVKFVVNNQAQEAWLQARDAQFEKTKKNYRDMEMRPDLWDYGREANNSIKAEAQPADTSQAANANQQTNTAA